VFFKVGGNASTIETSMLRTEIKEIIYAPPQNIPQLGTNPTQILRDSAGNSTQTVTQSSISIPSDPLKLNSFSFLVGYAIPVGKFAQVNSDSGNIRPGIIGQNIQLAYHYHGKKNFILGMHVFFAQNQINTNPLRSYYKSLIDSAWLSEKAVWRAYGIQVAGGYSKEVKDFLFSVRIQAGFATLVHPQFKLYTNSSNYREYQKVATDAITYGAGFSAGYKLLEDLYITADVSFINGRFNFKEVLIQGEEPSASGFPKRISQTKRNVKQEYQNLMLNIGLSYRF